MCDSDVFCSAVVAGVLKSIRVSCFVRDFRQVELNRTSLYWGLLLICILSAGNPTKAAGGRHVLSQPAGTPLSLLSEVLFSSYFFN